MIWRLALRELRFSGPKLRLVLFILFIGFVGPFLSSSLRYSVSHYLEVRSRQILSADIAVSSLRPLEEDVFNSIREDLKAKRTTQEIEFVTMGRGRDVATLIEVKGVDNTFPIYGTFKFDDGTTASAEALSKEKIAWVFPEVLAQLGLKAGDELGIGKIEFRIAAILEDAPGVGRTAGLAPRIYVGRKFVNETGLTQFGSQVFHRVYVELPAGVDPETARVKHKDPDVNIRTPEESIQRFERFFKFFNLYLVTISMIVFVLSWTSAFYILQIFLQDRLKNSAILMINGASRLRAGVQSALQVLLVMAIAFLASGLFVQILIAIANRFFAREMPEGFVLYMPLRQWLTLSGVALASALAFNAPFFARISLLRLQTLLGESVSGTDRLPRGVALVTYIPLLILFLGLSAWLMDSVKDSFRLAGGLMLGTGVGWFAGRVLFRAFFRALKAKPGHLRLVATQLARSRFGVNLCFLALTLISISLNLVPHLLSSVVSEMQPLQGKEIPSLFLLNIPDSQLDRLKTFANEKNVELRYLSPLILGRFLSVNGETERDSDFKRFPVRLSYREGRIPSETLIEGRDLPKAPTPGAEPEISVEMRFAERNGIKLGDKLEFDIQSIPITATVTSLRKVKWTTFNPNFFIMFQAGVLDDAPKTWLANVNLPEEDAEAARAKKVKLQYELTRDFPDLSVIDIGRTINRVLDIAQSVIGPVRAAAWTAVGMSFLILLGVILHNLRLRENEIAVQKLLGADGPAIRRLLVGEYATMAFFAWFTGAATSIAIAWIVARQVFDLPLSLSWESFVASAVAGVGVTIAIAYVSASRVLNLRGLGMLAPFANASRDSK